MSSRLADYIVYLAVATGLTLWVGRALYRDGTPFLAGALGDRTLAGSANRLLVTSFSLVGLGAAALLLPVGDGAVSAADVVRAVATRIGLLLLLLGGLHAINLLVIHRLRRPADGRSQPVREERPEPRARRFPY